MKKIIIIILIAVLLVSAYLFRIQIIQAAMPGIAQQFGLQLDELLIDKIDLSQVSIRKLVFTQASESYLLEVTLHNIKFDLNATLNMGMSIKDIQAESVMASLHSLQAAETQSRLTVKDYMQYLPIYGVNIDNLDFEFYSKEQPQFTFNGKMNFQHAMRLVGMASYRENEFKLNLMFDDQDFKLSVSDQLGRDEIFNIHGDYQIDDDWLLLASNGSYMLDQSFLLQSFKDSDYVLKQLTGEFIAKAEFDLMQTFELALLQSVAELDFDAALILSSKRYALQNGEIAIHAKCLLKGLEFDSCDTSQPQHMMLEFSQSPKFISQYTSRQFKKYFVDITPSDLLTIQRASSQSGYHLHGDANIIFKSDSSDLKAELNLTEFMADWKQPNWSGSGKYVLNIDIRQLEYIAEMQRALFKASGKLFTNQDKTEIRFSENTSLALYEIFYEDIEVGRLQVLPSDKSVLEFMHADQSLRMSKQNLLFEPKNIVYLDNHITIDSAMLDVHQFEITNAGIDIDSDLSIAHVQIKKPGFSIAGSDVHANLVTHEDHLKAEGGFLLGSKQAPLDFSIDNNITEGAGSLSFESEPISLMSNEVIAQIIGVTGFPLQLKDGSFSLYGNMSWQDEYHDIETLVNISAMQVDGDYAQNIFENLNIDMQLRGGEGWVLVEPSELTIQSVNVGVLLNDVRMQLDSYEFGVQAQPAIKIVDFFAAALDGSIFSQDINIDLNKVKNEFSFNLSSLSLEKLIELNQTKDLAVSGIIDGELPMTLNSGVLEINSGWMEADEQGGFIQYGRVKEVLKGNKDLRLVAELLEDFQYNELSVRVNLAPSGALRLETKLHGHSPDAEFNTPVNLNFNIDLNLWKFLESARLLTRIGEDITQQISSPAR